MKPVKAPLYEALIHHVRNIPSSFHVPGHQYGRYLMDSRFDLFKAIMSIDLTELSPLDNLHQPKGVIQESQQLAAQVFGAEETYFLVGGSTSGNIAAILALCDPGDIIIVQRNVHKSVLNGILLAGAKPVFLAPSVHGSTGLSTLPDIQDVEKALIRYPEAVGVLLTNPNYYGMSVPLDAYAKAVHRHGKPLVVDEAHGAHYGQHEAFPSSALKAGADAVIQSTHKTLTAMTMGAMIHIQGKLIPRSHLRQALGMVQSSSPSYPIMASLDIARAMLENDGQNLFASAMGTSKFFKENLAASFQHLSFHVKQSDGILLDPLRAVVWDGTGTLTGYELLEELAERGCWAEMADTKHVVILFGISSAIKEAEKLAAAFRDIENCKELYSKSQSPHWAESEMDSADYDRISEPVTLIRRPPSEIETETVSLLEAAGRTSAEMIVPYPPGIPVLYPGEIISIPVLRLLTQLMGTGADCQGAEDPLLNTIRVLRIG